MRIMFLLLSQCAVVSVSQAKPVYLSYLRSEFSGAPLTQECNLCHMTPGLRLNPFGKDFAAFKREFGFNNMGQVFMSLRPKDSDGDELSNESEIHDGRHPGIPGR